MAQLDARSIAQVDIEHDAQGLIEIIMTSQRSRRLERHGLKTVLPEQPAHALQHRGIIIDDKDGFRSATRFLAFRSLQKSLIGQDTGVPG